MRRKYLFSIHGLTGGGAERVIALIASGLARRGHDVLLAVDARADDNAGFLDPAVRVVPIGTGHVRGIAALARLLATERPDVSMSALGASNLKHALAALRAGRAGRAVLSCHGHFENEPGLLSRLGNLAVPVTSRLTARTVAVSAELRGHLIRGLAGPARTVVIHNPIATGAACPARSEAELLAREPLVLAAGRLVPNKGFAELIRAVAALDARLVILGEGHERGALRAEAERLGMAHRVEMPGYQPEPWAWFRRARVFALASHREAFGNVVVEALAHGLPVVATDCGGPREILEDGRHGALVPVGDDAALARALREALAHPGDPAPRVLRAADFAVETVLDRYEQLFSEIAPPR